MSAESEPGIPQLSLSREELFMNQDTCFIWGNPMVNSLILNSFHYPLSAVNGISPESTATFDHGIGNLEFFVELIGPRMEKELYDRPKMQTRTCQCVNRD